MKNLLKSLFTPYKGEDLPIPEPKLDTSVIVEKKTFNPKKITIKEIHDDFKSEVDELLKFSREYVDDSHIQKELAEKAKKLNRLGFFNSLDSIQGNKEIAKEIEIEKLRNEKEILNRAILYFSKKYPLYRFITQESVKKLCKKYGLVYGPVEYYIGSVPDKNLEEILNFKIDQIDAIFKIDFKIDYFYDSFGKREMEEVSYIKLMENLNYDYITVNSHKQAMEIIAPLAEFDKKNLNLNNFKLEVKPPEGDPIVLQPVSYEGKKFYLIITAWGDEAGDPEVVNSINN